MSFFSKRADRLLADIRVEHDRVAETDELGADAIVDEMQELWYDAFWADDEDCRMPAGEVIDLLSDVVKNADKGRLVVAREGQDMFLWIGTEKDLLAKLRGFLRDLKGR